MLAPETATLFIGGGEIIDGANWPHGWREIAFASTDWPAAPIVAETHDKIYGGLSSLVAYSPPDSFMREEVLAFKTIVQGECGDRVYARELMKDAGGLGLRCLQEAV